MSVKADLIKSIHDRYKGVNKSYEVSSNELKGLISTIYAPGPSFYAIFDFEIKRVEYVNNKIKDVLGIDPQVFSMDQIMEQIHEDDISHMGNCQHLIEIFTRQILTNEERPFYKRSFQYRMKHIDGSEKVMLHQSMLIYNGAHKFLGKSFILISNISQFTDVRNEGVSFIDNRGHKSYHNITSAQQLNELSKSLNELSERELEILRMISEGYKSKEIASMLNITYDTVRTHRNNILKRKGFKNISQAMAYYLRKGVL